MATFNPGAAIARKIGPLLCGTLCTLIALPIQSATFPNSPLITGGNGIPPNILLILDDSGSMSYRRMPVDSSSGLGDNVSDRSYINNTLYYNPSTPYAPWRTASTVLTDRLANASVSAASGDSTSPTGNEVDLRNSGESIYYFPKPNVSDPGTNSANYDKFRIATSSSANAVDGAVVQKYNPSTEVVETTTGINIASKNYTVCKTIDARTWEGVVVETSGGGGDADLYVWSGNNCNGNADYVSQSNTNNESFVGGSSRISVRIYAYSAVGNLTLTISKKTNWTEETPVYKDEAGASQQRGQAAELQNFANWYQYFRTRTKTAKAGASEAFGKLGTRFRVGFDTIWNRGGDSESVTGSTPAFPIPYATDDGLFSGTNRSTFYSRLQGAVASNGTPLHGALDRAGRYFQTDDPWKDSAGNKLSCRQNYALLTTDGYWNSTDSSNGWTTDVANADGVTANPYRDNFSKTLADVAYYYWANDLKTGTGWDNNVKPSTGDPATWQHMVTFGVSIGLQGFLDPKGTPPGANQWKDPWKNPLVVNGLDTGDDGNGRSDNNESKRRIDDLWHAALNGHGKFVVAGNAKDFADALASALDTITQRTASGSNIASSSTKTDAGTLTFAAKFTSGSWIGDLSASPFNAALTGVSTTANWALSSTFGSGGVNETFKDRFVMASWGGTAFRLTDTYSDATSFARTSGTDSATGAENIRYILGDQSKEQGKANGTLRKRDYPMGDIVDSSPSFNTDTGVVYVGANDGMMHAINSTNGKVLFSYIPNGIAISDLKTLSAVEYDHRYFMDGQIDTISKAKQGYGKNILIGAPGRGAKGVFALDVTTPTSFGTSNFLWDKTSAVDNDMGYVLGNVRIRPTNKMDANNKPTVMAIVPNGIDSQSGKAIIFVYELTSTGAVNATYKLTTDASIGNGMMSTGLADLDGNGTIDTLYGGDLLGRVWKWDLNLKSDGTFPLTTGTNAGTKLFQATDGTNAQPITGGIGVNRDSTGQVFIGFGTGRLISASDVPGNTGYVQQTQSLYGIKDNGALVTRTELQSRTIPFTGTVDGKPARGFEVYQDLPSGKKGWYVNLGVPAATATGERVYTAPTMVGSAMWISSAIPAQGSDCSGALGSGYLNVINIFTGTSPLQNSYFDTTSRVPGTGSTTGLLGSVGITGGMPTEVNVTSQLATVGDGGGGNPQSFKRTLPIGGVAQRMNWREIVAADE